MCGIAGFTGRCDLELLREFGSLLHHRGPDHWGHLCRDPISLSSNRLAIIDLASGNQPIWNEDGTCAIVFNGEIYNHRELRQTLERRHVFRTRSDTEVILHLYEEYGPDVSSHLSGDFAFCIWDGAKGSCLLSRDHLGVKPLYYAVTPSGGLVFSSELAPVLRHPEILPELDLEAVLEYLTCLYVPAPRSLIRGIRKLPPGHTLLWNSGGLRTWRYWGIPEPEPDRGEREAAFAEQSLTLLRQAVHRRLIADVPVGAFLSGGLDSSMIVALASERCRNLQTFSVGYREADFDELKFARKVSRAFSTDHHEFILQPDSRRLLETVIAAMDEPIADSSAIPTFLVAAETRKFVKVALSGIGGDEMFGGYPRYLGVKTAAMIPPGLRFPLALASRFLSSKPTGSDTGGRLRRFGLAVGAEPARQYWQWTTFLSPDLRTQLLSAERRPSLGFETEALGLFRSFPGDSLDKVFRFDLQRYLASDLLKVGDAMSMANSLELRVPFCDVDLVEFMARAPSALRFPGYGLKPVLKEIAARFLPAEILRRRKQGFMVPIGRWFRGELQEYLRAELRPARLPRFLEAAAVTKLVEEHAAASANHTHLLWAILVLSRWLAAHPTVRV